MRISRPDYDKYRRCPGWVGGGFRFAKVDRCNNGFLDIDYDKPYWKWLVYRCSICRAVVLPYYIRWVDPSWYYWYISFKLRSR